jgi:hypothetical protein
MLTDGSLARPTVHRQSRLEPKLSKVGKTSCGGMVEPEHGKIVKAPGEQALA